MQADRVQKVLEVRPAIRAIVYLSGRDEVEDVDRVRLHVAARVDEPQLRGIDGRLERAQGVQRGLSTSVKRRRCGHHSGNVEHVRRDLEVAHWERDRRRNQERGRGSRGGPCERVGEIEPGLAVRAVHADDDARHDHGVARVDGGTPVNVAEIDRESTRRDLQCSACWPCSVEQGADRTQGDRRHDGIIAIAEFDRARDIGSREVPGLIAHAVVGAPEVDC